MAANERTIADVLQDIVRNIQEIVRSEVRLAKTEVRDEAAKAKTAGILSAAGAITGIFGAGFVLLAIVYALSTVMPNWAAALIVGLVLAITAWAVLNAGLNRFRKVHATPERTMETLKENVQWVQQQTK